MKAVGIIAEYNPFHNGHAYQIKKIKEETGADYVIVAMSGDFLQRGVPALADKYTRSRMALLGGADLVLELPARWACASAEYFAAAGVQLLAKCGVADTLCYGCEDMEPELTRALSEALCAESEAFSKCLREQLKSGFSYPVARSNAACAVLPDWDAERVRAFLTSPNNILALEYEKAVARWNAQGGHAMHTHAIRRIGEGYHSEALSGSFVSATAIRSRLLGARDAGLKGNTVPDALREKMPDASFEALCTAAEAGLLLDTDDFSGALYARLWEHREAGYEAFADCGGELSRRISTHLDAFTSFTQFAGLLKSREYTYTRICRALLHILLDIKQSDYALLWEKDAVPYLRVLGFRRDAAPLLSAIKKEASAPLVTKVADASRMLPPEALSLLRQDIRCADLYRGVAAIRTGQALPNEYTQGIVLV